MAQLALAPGHAREYETIYILRPNIEKDKADDVANRISNAIKGNNGKVLEAELWGSRRLAYPINRHHRGTYVYVKYLSRGEAVTEIERQLRLVDSVIRYQTVMLKSQVPLEGIEGVEDLELDFDMPFEADEPEVTVERSLGLDAPFADRRGRRDRDNHRDDDEDDLGMDDDDDEDDVRPPVRPKPRAEAAEAPKPEAAAKPDAEAKADSTTDDGEES
jgi:small subunit ribosomal protein S6